MVMFRSVDGHQDEQAELRSSVEAMKKSSSTIRYAHYTENLQDRDKCIAKRKRVEAFRVIRWVVKSEAMIGTHVRMKEIGKSSYDFVEFVIARWTKSSRVLSK